MITESSRRAVHDLLSSRKIVVVILLSSSRSTKRSGMLINRRRFSARAAALLRANVLRLVFLEAVLAQLVDEGYLSDARFAEVFVRSRHDRGVGPLKIRAELRERGVVESLVEDAFRELAADWFDAARQQRDKRFGASPPQDFKERARQIRFLQRRGFSGEQVRAALDTH